MSGNSSRSGFGLILAVVVILIGVGAFLYSRSLDNGIDGNNGNNGGGDSALTGGGDGPGSVARPLTSEEYAGVYEFANTGLGHLENHEYVKAESTFRALCDKLPGERLPLQNLAITQTMMVVDQTSSLVKDRKKNPAAYEQAVVAARETLTDFAKQDEALASMFNGLISQKMGDTERGITEFQAAAEKAETNASYWFTLYAAHAELKGRPDRSPYPLAVTAIEKTLELVPENLHAIGEAIQTQARSKSPKLADTLIAAKVVTEPLAASIKTQLRFPIQERFDAAIEDLKNNGTRGAGMAQGIANVLKSDIAKRIDQRNLDKNLLEYVVVAFGKDFDQQATTAGYALPIEEQIDVTFEAVADGLPDSTDATDVRIADMNLDGVPDVVLVRPSGVEIHAQGQADGKPSGEWNLAASYDFPEGSSYQRVLLADLDRDFEAAAHREFREIHNGTGLPSPTKQPPYVFMDTSFDLAVYGSSGVLILRNTSDEDGVKVSTKRKLSLITIEDESFAALADITTAATADIEHDGDLDLVFGSASGLSFWVNGSTKKTVRFIPGNQHVDKTPAGEEIRSIIPVDWNRDIATDFLVLTSGSVGLMQNVLHSRFRWRDLGPNKTGGNAAAVGEFNGDAAWDVLVGTDDSISVNLLSQATIEGTSWLSSDSIDIGAQSVQLLDYDNDSFLDAIVLNEKATILRGGPGGKFQAADVLSEDYTGVTASHVGDVDLDGDEDLILTGTGGTKLLKNQGGNKNNWIRIALRPDPNPEQFPANRINMHGIGCVLEMKSGARYQARTADSPQIHFGLGSRKQADVMRIIWTDGIPHNLVDAPAVRTSTSFLAPHYLVGSCPYIYTWDGSQFLFYSDCLWAAPLGLQQAEGVFAPSREWEYIKIDGSAMKARDGKHVLKITEELWEATYLDEVKLIAVDHPVGTDVFSNEKVGPPHLTEFKIHGVKEPKLPVAASDKTGRDLLPLLKAKDKKYARPFRARIKQGLTDPHYMELDLGKIEDPDNVTLFLVGWVFPTDTNINIGIDQADQPPPKPPAIQVPDSDGEWVEAIPFVGFPGGKTKTIAIDLSGAFKCDDYRVRLTTSMELYWDAAFFIDGEQHVPIKQTPLPLLSAELQYRGFSRREYAGSVFSTDGFGPETYDYNNVSTLPTWLPMDGNFTKYGNVLPLLTTRDDLQVVFGAGDEVTLEFDANEASLADGWVRDYLLYNVGWDKDVKQNTVYGSTVEPLPYEGMKSYTDPDSAFPQTQKHKDFLKTWQTRTQNLRRFRNWVREFDTSRRKSSE